MALVNEHFLKLPNNYLFSDIAKKVNAFKVSHPQKDLIRLGIGDVTQPLPQASIEAMHKAVDELASKETFRGYGPEQGYDFLIDAILKNDYASRGVHLESGEIFVSDGAKSDTGNIGDILRHDNSIGVTDPIYPVYIDSNVMCGRAGVLENGRWSNVVYLPCLSENNFIPAIPDRRIDILYLCYPNNPTGTVISKAELKKWVNYALENDTLILYDAAYEAYIQDPDIPHSIYEIKGAKKVAIEFRSFSKTAGFTGIFRNKILTFILPERCFIHFLRKRSLHGDQMFSLKTDGRAMLYGLRRRKHPREDPFLPVIDRCIGLQLLAACGREDPARSAV